ncbi:MAG: Dabb family protein, partial [Eubacterium sp.]|nr:Dabb family protein [Eubacterium sp.]
TDGERSKAAEILRSMEGNVPQLRGIEVGCDFLHSPRSYDIILQVTLDSADELDAYQNDEYHCSVVKKHMHAVAESSVAIDYKI